MSDTFPASDPTPAPRPPGGLPPAGTPPVQTPPGPVPWRVRDLLFTVLGGFALSVLLVTPLAMVALDEPAAAPSLTVVGGMGILVYVGLAIAGWYFALKRRGVGWREAGFRPVPAGTLLLMVPVTIGMMVLTFLVVGVSAVVFGDVPTAQDQIVGEADSITFEEFAWLFALGAIAAPLVEEFLFRGLLYPLLRGRMKVALAVLVSALLFASLHFFPTLIPALLTMGIVLAFLTERYDSILPSIGVHALNNGVAIVGIYLAIGQ